MGGANALLWIAGGQGPLFWALAGVAAFVYLVLVRLGMDYAVEIMIRKPGPLK
jgi:hypothetical protein